MSIGKIEKKFGYGVWNLICRKSGSEWAVIGEQVRQEIRDHNDISEQWNPGDLIASLQLNTRARVGLMLYYENSRKVSIKEFMDLVVLDNPIPDRLYGCTRLLKLRNIGRLGFWHILERLSTLDLGEQAGNEWQRKLELLRRYGRKEDLPRDFMGDSMIPRNIMAC